MTVGGLQQQPGPIGAEIRGRHLVKQVVEDQAAVRVSPVTTGKHRQSVADRIHVRVSAAGGRAAQNPVETVFGRAAQETVPAPFQHRVPHRLVARIGLVSLQSAQQRPPQVVSLPVSPQSLAGEHFVQRLGEIVGIVQRGAQAEQVVTESRGSFPDALDLRLAPQELGRAFR